MQVTNSLRVVPAPWLVVDGGCDKAAGRGGGGGLGTKVGIGAWIDRNGDVNLSVSRPRKREIMDVTTPYSV